MKKIAILTFYNHINYGTVLQATALQHIIKSLGADAEFLDYRREIKNNIKETVDQSFCKRLLHIFPYIFSYIRTNKARNNKIKKFHQFCIENQEVSKKVYYDQEDLSLATNNYNGFVAGSDMVWSPVIHQDLDYFFMTFAPKEKRMSYAASLTGTNSFTIEQHKKFKKYINGLNLISCREQEGVDYVKQMGRDAALSIDPTLLLDKKQWKLLLHINKEKQAPHYILYYMFNGKNSHVLKQAKKLARQQHLQLRFIPMELKEYSYEYLNGYTGSYGPKEFVELFINASFVITNSYHGLMFSLISQKPFVVIKREKENIWKENANRISNMLEIVNQDHRYIENDAIIDKQFLTLDYTQINQNIELLRNNSFIYLKHLILSLPETSQVNPRKIQLRNIETVSIKDCSGCELCKSVCPVSCIKMEPNNEGFLYPQINHIECIDCGKCVKFCPAVNDMSTYYSNKPIGCYAAFSDSKLLARSASGGLFVTAAEYVINLKGVVYGVVLNEKTLRCEFSEAETIEGIKQMQDSKYIQPVVCDIYIKVKQKLQDGRIVLFSGSPCHIAALYCFLGREKYDNLFTLDIICHGVPSPNFWHRYLHENPNKIVSARFRNRENKKKHIHTLSFSLGICNGKYQYISGPEDIFFGTYLRCENLRYSCYYCKYSDLHRYGDITIGDFDSVEQLADFEPEESKNTIIINTIRGKELWNRISCKFIYKKINIHEEAIVNTSLYKPSNMPVSRSSIYNELNNLPWSEFCNKYTFKISKSKKFLFKIIHLVKLFE